MTTYFTNKFNIKSTHPLHRWLILTVLMALSACSEKMVPAAIEGYNHMPYWAIAGFSVNGGSGFNLDPGGGGGSQTCCVLLPERWHPGLKAKIAWRYDTDQGGPTPPPPQSAEVEIPEYRSEDISHLDVHFFPNHKVKVVVTHYGLGHANYPKINDAEFDAVVKKWNNDYENFRKGVTP